MRFTRRSSTGAMESLLPLTSLIDVVFLLLIYFMLTTQSAPESELSSTLRSERRAAGQSTNLQAQVVHVELVDGSPAYRLGDRVMRTPKQLEDLLRRLPKDPGVFVRVSGRVSVEAASGALQAARDAGFVRVSYVPATD